MVPPFGLETWVMIPFMGFSLGIFYNRVACRLTERQPQRLCDGGWDYHPLGGGDGGGNGGGGFGGGGGVRLEEKEYGGSVLLIMDLCDEVVQIPGKWVYKH